MADQLGLTDGGAYRLPTGEVCRALMAFSVPGAAWWLIGPAGQLHLVTYPGGQVLRAPAEGGLFPLAERCQVTGWYAGELAPVNV